MAWIDKAGPVEGCTVYRKGRLVARDATVVLPAVTFQTVETRAMGTLELPLPQIDAMELAITRVGVDVDTAVLATPGSADLEVRWVQDVVKADGTVAQVGCKAFLRAIPKGAPSLSVEVGSATEGEHAFSVSRYRLVIDGQEKLLVDQLADQLVINGTNYANKLSKLL